MTTLFAMRPIYSASANMSATIRCDGIWIESVTVRMFIEVICGEWRDRRSNMFTA